MADGHHEADAGSGARAGLTLLSDDEAAAGDEGGAVLIRGDEYPVGPAVGGGGGGRLGPGDEAARVEALRLYRILDTAPESAFDELVALTAHVCRAPIALLSLVDEERQWVKAGYGWEGGAAETPRADSFCDHAIRGSDLFFVPDARRDARFRALGPVVGPPQIRFYAAAPLVTDGGHAVGALCILDEAPRLLEDRQAEALQMLARQAMSLLELRRQALTLAEAVTDRAEVEEQARWQAQHDPLTGLPNRALFQHRLEEALARRAGRLPAAAASGSKPRGGGSAASAKATDDLAVLFVDLDRFKRINDTLGHASGDLLLREVAARFSGCLRPEDTLARMGGDEFTVLLPHIPGVSYATAVAQMLLRALRRPIQVAAQEFHVGASIGISLAPRDGEDVQTLLKHADIAMYQAKAKGGYQLYSRRMNEGSYQRLLEEAELRRALERDELSLHFQPQVDLETGEIRVVEALARWRHPDRGPIPPAHFIPLAEQADLIVPLGEWVLRNACLEAARWRAEVHPALRVAVNLSGRHILQPRLVESVEAILAETGLPADALDIELTETSLSTGGEPTPQTLQALRAMGIRLSVDDFGTGYSSLAYLRRFPVDILKIDRTFVAHLDRDTTDSTLVRACIEMAHALGVLVVAEGVETEAQARCLKDLGCDLVQGYLYSRPVSPEVLRTLLLARRIRGTLRGMVPRLAGQA